jgi:hypothetical protein
MITETSVIARNTDHVSCDLDGETVLMSVETGKYYGMDPVASRIWELIETPASVAAICTQLTDEFDVAAARCREDVLDFVSALAEEGLVEVGEAE